MQPAVLRPRGGGAPGAPVRQSCMRLLLWSAFSVAAILLALVAVRQTMTADVLATSGVPAMGWGAASSAGGAVIRLQETETDDTPAASLGEEAGDAGAGAGVAVEDARGGEAEAGAGAEESLVGAHPDRDADDLVVNGGDESKAPNEKRVIPERPDTATAGAGSEAPREYSEGEMVPLKVGSGRYCTQGLTLVHLSAQLQRFLW
jgi:hypothetical protein